MPWHRSAFLWACPHPCRGSLPELSLRDEGAAGQSSPRRACQSTGEARNFLPSPHFPAFKAELPVTVAVAGETSLARESLQGGQDGDATMASGSYADVYRESHSGTLDSILKSVQEPPPGNFDHKALEWEFLWRNYGTQHESRYVMQCNLPLNRVPDFVSGEENKAGLRCKYVRTRMLNNTREPLLQPRSDSALYVDK